MRPLELTIIWLIICAALDPSVAAAAPARSILVMDQSEARGPFYYQIFAGLRSTVNADPGPPITIYSEHLDLSRFGGSAYEESLKSHLRTKYQDKPIGVLVAIGATTLSFVLRMREELWPGLPVVFGLVDEQAIESLPIESNLTGRVTALRFRDMMTTARAIVPDLARVAISATRSSSKPFSDTSPRKSRLSPPVSRSLTWWAFPCGSSADGWRCCPIAQRYSIRRSIPTERELITRRLTQWRSSLKSRTGR